MAALFARGRPGLARPALAATAVLAPAPGMLALATLCTAGRATPRARSLAGTRVVLRGYLAPMPRPQLFLLSDDSQMPCQACGSLHEGGASLMVHAVDAVLRTIPMHDAAEVSGTLAIGPAPGSFHAPDLLLIDAIGHRQQGPA